MEKAALSASSATTVLPWGDQRRIEFAVVFADVSAHRARSSPQVPVATKVVSAVVNGRALASQGGDTPCADVDVLGLQLALVVARSDHVAGEIVVSDGGDAVRGFEQAAAEGRVAVLADDFALERCLHQALALVVGKA